MEVDLGRALTGMQGIRSYPGCGIDKNRELQEDRMGRIPGVRRAEADFVTNARTFLVGWLGESS